MPKRKRSYTSSMRRRARRVSRAVSRKLFRTYRMGMFRTGGFSPYAGRLGSPEKKFFDLTQTLTSAFLTGVTAGQVSCINIIAAGTNVNQRVGRQIMMDYIMVRFQLSVTATAAGLSQAVRCALVYDDQNNGAALPSGSAIVTPDTIYGLTNLDNRLRFRFLMEKHFYIGPATAANSGINTVVHWHKFVKLPKDCRKVIYNGTAGGTNADIQTGNIYLIFWQDGFIAGTPPILTGNVNTRVRFCDA
ncbi:capsid [uncultured virus]|uniref:Capsid n=1 Tax=uncultured virus TaxID=340016 RepID=A0A2K9LSM6_9VIRU|nr:capsid [uncultured virus]